MNRIESSQATSGARVAGLGGDPRRLPVVDEVQVVLDVPLGAQHQGLRATARGARPVSCWVVIECSQDSRSGPVTVTTPRCERSTTASPSVEQALLAQRVAVVGGDAGVRPVAFDGSGAAQERASGAGRSRRAVGSAVAGAP